MSIKVLHIVAGDLSGGAARGAYWLHKGLLRYGIESRMVVQNYNGTDSTVEAVTQTDIGKGLKLLRSQIDIIPTKIYRNREKFIFSTGITGFDIRKSDFYQWADIIHLHWINGGMVNINLLNKIDKPIVWTMRDMWPMTGGCHYAMECKGYENECGLCPQLKSNYKHDLSRYVLKRKKRCYPDNLNLVAISTWLAECAKNSYLFNGFNIDVVPNAVDTNDFFPISPEIARDVLGLPKDKKIVLAGATNIHDMYKGFGKFRDAIQHLNKDYLFLFFGRTNNEDLDLLGINYKALGFLRDSISLRLAYSAADVFVAPSVQEAFGKTLIEAMACGTPVVAFDATGPKDIVDHKITGYLAQPFDTYDLARGISWVLEDDDNLHSLSIHARIKFENRFGIEAIAMKYSDIYSNILI
ncbi:glycosyltransferase family 4 protein [Methanococcoides orientis]|uniref:glycosyltransferase family 4 protein n=1 Tax=Methanococcoides orientis TaxID=2822137 RepID=UPI001E50CEEA|nr:glycosyltransferase family 4 protein [Methanococcoides orientis]UGV40303.1 glycosyltransferase family 4 protein [Methanococcoides orientis]